MLGRVAKGQGDPSGDDKNIQNVGLEDVSMGEAA